MPIFKRTNYIITADSAESALIRYNVQPFTECDGNRCCDDIICPPEDGHVNA
jgi:hypothetical protein